MVKYDTTPLDLLPEPQAVRDIQNLLLLIEALDLTNLRPEWVERLYSIRRRYPSEWVERLYSIRRRYPWPGNE